MTRGIENLLDFYERDWSERKENVGRSFTMGACLYDYIRENRGSFDDLGIEWEVNDIIENESGANREWVENLSDDVKAEILDIAVLWELVENQEEEYKQEQMEELYDELDGNGDYKSRDEVEEEASKIIDDYYIDEGLADVVDGYIDDRGLDFEEMLFDYLDGYSFVDKQEIIGAIELYYYPDEEGQKENASYGELSEYDDIAQRYIDDRGLEFEEEKE